MWNIMGSKANKKRRKIARKVPAESYYLGDVDTSVLKNRGCGFTRCSIPIQSCDGKTFTVPGSLCQNKY